MDFAANDDYRINAALLPELWAIVRDFFYPAEWAMMAGLKLELTKGVTIPGALNLAFVVRDGQFNVLQWLYAAPAPATDYCKFFNMTRDHSIVRADGRNMVTPPVSDHQIACQMWGSDCGRMQGVARIQPGQSIRHQPQPYNLKAIIAVAIFCNHSDILKWIIQTQHHSLVALAWEAPWAELAEHTSIETMQWVSDKFPDLQGNDWKRLMALFAGAECGSETKTKRAWIKETAPPRAAAVLHTMGCWPLDAADLTRAAARPLSEL